jgi:cytochrome P450
MTRQAEPVSFPRPVTADGQPDPELRRLVQQTPVLRVTAPGGVPAWLVGSHELVREVLSDPSRFTNVIDPSMTNLRANMAVQDPPEHTRLRKLAAQAFTARRIQSLRPAVERLVDSLLDDMATCDPPADLVTSLAMPLPVRVICRILGVPQDDEADLQRWTNMFTAMTTYSAEEIAESVEQMNSYMTRLIQKRRTDLGDDVLSNLIRARDGQDALSEEELIATIMLLLVAGCETTSKAITRGVMALSSSGLWSRFAATDSVLDQVVEEVLRHQAPIDTALFRWAKSDTTLGGVPIKAGEQLFVSVHLANYDAGVRGDPQQFDPDRSDAGHLSFGHGVHFCLGAALARLELIAVFDALITRFPTLRLATPVDRLTWSVGSMLNAPTSLPVAW